MDAEAHVAAAMKDATPGIDLIERRVLGAIPTWKQMPRVQRQMIMLLDSHGPNLKSMCWQEGIDYAKAEKDFTGEFKAVIKHYEQTGKYPRHVGWKRDLNAAHINALYYHEAVAGNFIKLEGGKPGTFTNDLVREGLEGLAERKEIWPELKGETSAHGQTIEDGRIRGGKTPEEWQERKAGGESGLPQMAELEAEPVAP